MRRLLALPWGIGATFRQGPGVPSTGPAGVFFACRTTDASGGARYWRFVDDQGVSSDELPIIRRINPGAADGTDIPADIEPAWRLAIQSIIDEHNGRANPPPETSRLPPSQRFALELLADPAVALPDGAEDAYELLAAPRDGAVKLALSTVQRRLAARDIGRIDAAREIVGIVREYGLTPVPPPPALQSITEDDVGVVCWMRVLSPESIVRPS